MKNLAFKPRKCKNTVPIGWTPTDIRGPAHWRCKEIQFDFLNQEYRRCSYSCEKKNIRYHKNKHIFEIPQSEDKEFPEYIKEKIKNDTHDNFNKRYVHHLAILSGKMDISCKKAVSDPFRDFSLFLLKEGQNIGRNEKTAKINIEQSLEPVSIKELSNEIINVSDAYFENEIQKFSGKHYCSLVCDAGTVLKFHSFHVVLTFFNNPVQKILFESYDNGPFDSGFYYKSFKDVYDKLQMRHIEICSITTDNLQAQISGWELFQKVSDDQLIQSIYRIPCFGHLSNLVFKDVLKRSTDLNNYVQNALLIMKIIRNKNGIQFIGSKCPGFSQTRWLYTVDILLYLLHNREKINNFIQMINAQEDSDIQLVDSNIEFTYKVLVPLKLFSLIVEKDDFQLYNIIPLTREFFKELQSLYNIAEFDEWKQIINEIDASMRLRLMHNAYDQVTTSYALSSVGRTELRQKYRSHRTENYGALSFAPPVETLYKERIDFEFKYTPDYQDELPAAEVLKILEEEEEEEEDYLEPDLTQESIETDELFIKIDEMLAISYEERTKKDVYRNIYTISKTELTKTGSLIDIDANYIEEKFDEFLFSDPLQLDFIKYSAEVPYKFWQKAFCYDEQWELFSDLALRYSCAFATETIVERMLSIQKHIQNDCMTNVSKQMAKARLRLHHQTNKSKQ